MLFKRCVSWILIFVLLHSNITYTHAMDSDDVVNQHHLPAQPRVTEQERDTTSIKPNLQDQNSLQLQSQSESPKNVLDNLTPEKGSPSSSNTATPERSPRNGAESPEDKSTLLSASPFQPKGTQLGTSESSDSSDSAPVSPHLGGDQEGKEQSVTSIIVTEGLKENSSKASITQPNTGKIITPSISHQEDEGEDEDAFFDALEGEDITINVENKNAHKISKEVKPPSSQPKTFSEKTPLIPKTTHQDDEAESLITPSKDTPSSPPKQSFISQVWNFATGFFKKKKPEKEIPSTSVTDFSSPLIMPNDGDADSSEGEDESVEGRNKDTSSGEEEKTLGQKNPSINQSQNQGSSKELNLYDPEEKSWVIVDLYKHRDADKKGKTTSPQQKEKTQLPHSKGKPTPPLNDENKDGDPNPGKKEGVTIVDIDDPSLSPAVRAFLLHVKDRVIDGKPTTAQVVIGGIGGTLIGVGVGQAMGPIFANSLDDLGGIYTYLRFNNSIFADSLLYHTNISLGIDSMSRNIRILGEIASPSTEEFSIPIDGAMKKARRTFLVVVYTASGIAALLPVYYLWDSQEKHIEKAPEFKNRFLTFFGCLAVPLLLDSALTIAHVAKNWIDEKINNVRIHLAYAYQASKASMLRQQELNRFQDLIHLFAAMSDEEIQKAYHQIYKNTQSNTSFSEDKTKILNAINILNILRTIHKDSSSSLRIPEQELESERAAASTLFGWGIPAWGSPGRSIVFWFALDEMLNSLGMPFGAARQCLAIVFGEIVAAGFQGALEVNTVKKAVSDLFFSDRKSENSYNPVWKAFRKIGKGYTYLQGAWNTLPYMLAGLKATRRWPTWSRIVTISPFGLADMCNNTISYQKSYGNTIGAIESMVAHCGQLTPGYMRKMLMTLAKKCYTLYNHMSPEVVEQLEDLLEPRYK